MSEIIKSTSIEQAQAETADVIINAELEQAAGVFNVCHVARRTPDGRLVPSTPGSRLAPCVAVLPEVCATTEEWLKKYAIGNTKG